MTPEAFRAQWSLPFEEFSEHPRPRFNCAPSQLLPVIRLNKDGERVIDLVRWGLIPHWTKGKPKSQPINARAETVATSGMFRHALDRRRCLVPADGFYEWLKKGDVKQPIYIHLQDDRPFGFAGLWERWAPDESSERVDTFTIITTTPNSEMRPIHDRMPVILPETAWESWLDRERKGSDVAALLQPYEDGRLETYPVSTHVNSPRNDDPKCVAPLAE